MLHIYFDNAIVETRKSDVESFMRIYNMTDIMHVSIYIIYHLIIKLDFLM